MALRSQLNAAALLTFAGAGAIGVWTERADRDLRTAVRRVLAGSGDVEVASVWTNPFSGRLSIRGLAIHTGTSVLHIGALDLIPNVSMPRLVASARAAAVDETAPSPAEPRSAASLGKASANDITYTSGGTTIRIPHVELSGTAIDDGALRKLLDPNASETIEARLRRLTAASILVSEMKIDSSQPGEEVHWTGRQILLANVVHGQASAASVGPSSLAIRQGASAGNAEVVGQDFKGLDLGGIAHAIEATRATDVEPLQPLCAAWTANAVRYVDVGHDRVFTLATAKAQGVSGRALRSASTSGDAMANRLDAGANAITLLADVAGSFAIQSVELDHGATGPASPTTPPTLTSRFEHLVVQNIGRDQMIGSIDLQNFELDHLMLAGGDNHVSVANTRAAGLRLKPSSTPAGLWQSSFEKFDVNDAALRIARSAADEAGRETVVTLKHAGFSAPGAATTPIPAQASSNFEGLAFDPLPGGYAQVLVDLGYKHVDLSGRSADQYDVAAKTFHLEGFDVDGAGLGSLHLAMDLADVSPSVTSPNATVQRSVIFAILFKEIDLSLKNDGLMDRAIALRAQTDGRSVPAERSFLQDLATTKLPALIGDPPKLHPLESAIAQFIADPKTIRVKVVSPHGVGAADFTASSPLDILDTLDIQATANQ